MDKENSLLRVKNLHVDFKLRDGNTLHAVNSVSLEIAAGEILGLVGESGSGKTVFSSSLLRLINSPGQISNGEILFDGKNILKFSASSLRSLRGGGIAMIFQNPQSSLNPVYSIGTQLKSILRLHQGLSGKNAQTEAINLLNLVKIPDPERRFNDYPSQFSLGMCQRIMIAMALACRPKLLIADEPTASLDVTIQAQIMDLLLELREKFQMAILLVSHDLGVIARMSDRIAVMYLGRIVEVASAKDLYYSPKHPYTKALLESIPIPDPNHRGKLSKIYGDIPSPLSINAGCRFKTRCPKAFEKCEHIDPLLEPVNGNEHTAACLLYQTDTLTTAN